MRKSLVSMSIDELSKLRHDIEEAITDRTADIRRQLGLIDGRRPSAGRPAKQRKSVPKRRGKVAPKYRGPGGVTWSGRGLKPRWLTAALVDGRSLEDFAIRRP